MASCFRSPPSMPRYDHLTHDELVRLLEARDRDSARFGLVWEANEIDRDKALNADFVALDLQPEHSVGAAPWRNLVVEGDNFDALRALRITQVTRRRLRSMTNALPFFRLW